MSNQLTTNTTTINELITMANNLPDAGSGNGGSGVIETCTVNLNSAVGYIQYCCATIFNDGMIKSYYIHKPESTTVTLNDVISGSALYFKTSVPVLPASTTTNAIELLAISGDWIFEITAGADEIANITVRDDD